MLEAMESDLGRPLTEEEERLALEPAALIELPRPKLFADLMTPTPVASQPWVRPIVGRAMRAPSFVSPCTDASRL